MCLELNTLYLMLKRHKLLLHIRPIILSPALTLLFLLIFLTLQCSPSSEPFPDPFTPAGKNTPKTQSSCPEFPEGSKQDQFLCRVTDRLYKIKFDCHSKRTCYYQKGIETLLELCNEQDLEAYGFNALDTCDESAFKVFRKLLPRRIRIKRSRGGGGSDEDCPPPSQCFQHPSSCPKRCPAERANPGTVSEPEPSVDPACKQRLIAEIDELQRQIDNEEAERDREISKLGSRRSLLINQRSRWENMPATHRLYSRRAQMIAMIHRQDQGITDTIGRLHEQYRARTTHNRKAIEKKREAIRGEGSNACPILNPDPPEN